jgi:hypothetical protein
VCHGQLLQLIAWQVGAKIFRITDLYRTSDDPEYHGTGDRSIYGRVENLKIEDDALWVLSHWTELGKKLFDGGFLRYLSPRWLMRKVRDRIFQPVRLISVGMTNHPNLYKENFSSSADGAQYSQFSKNEGTANKVCQKKELEVKF